MTLQNAYKVYINGIVQGVGFRPFVFELANRYGLHGWVRNTSEGVEIEISGSEGQLEQFITSLEKEAPPLSKIESLRYEGIKADGHESFLILHSHVVKGGFQPISPDTSICEDCRQELFTPTDPRYRYPFINCTNCGPRFTIITDIPYDRPKTTMANFKFCPNCKVEFENPLDRRFHAQPIACPHCGPRVWLEFSNAVGEIPAAEENAAILETQRLIAEGKIVAVKGLGGFHLACDAENSAAVQRLRKRKDRPFKPLAVMMPNLETVKKHCILSSREEALLTSPQRPILLLEKISDANLPDGLAPGQNTLGVMLPYTPLHYLLFSKKDSFPDAPYSVLVMTSANFSGNPILTENQQVRDQLDTIADAYLFHDREIHVHCDDTVARLPVQLSKDISVSYPIRRSRGFTPYPIKLPAKGKSVLGVGAELKNTFCLTKDDYAFISQHIGDLKNYETLLSFEESIQHFESLFRVEPELIVYDLHPDYLSTRYALERCKEPGIAALPVQHHHAHITSCLADNFYHGEEPVIGIAFDGIGYGDDGAIWGGEFLIADFQEYSRAGHLKYFPLPGGDIAIQQPWRTALSLLHSCGIPWEPTIPPVEHAAAIDGKVLGLSPLDVIKNQLITGINSPKTSSLGRLFDGVAALLGIRQSITYEGQAAIELEALVDPDEQGSYPFEISKDYLVDPEPMLEAVLIDLAQGLPTPKISARFHNGLSRMVLEISTCLRKKYGIEQVALSGGVWQNMTLLVKSIKYLKSAGFQVYIHQQVPPNDGGLALGQVVIGQKYLEV